MTRTTNATPEIAREAPQQSFGVWAHVGLYKEREGWVKNGKNLSYAEASLLADRLRAQDVTAYVKPMH